MEEITTHDDQRQQPRRGVAATALSGKGGTGKSFLQYHLAGEARAENLPTLVIDADPEQNLTKRFEQNDPGLMPAPGLGDVLVDAGILNDDDDTPYSIEAGAKKVHEVIRKLTWTGIHFLPAGKSLQSISQLSPSTSDWTWLIRDIFEAAELYQTYRLILPDTAGRRGSLVTMIMYACDVAYSPITSTRDAVVKAQQAKGRVEKIQEAHSLHWAGVVLTGLDLRADGNKVIREDAAEAFGASLDEKGKFTEWGEIITEIPYRPGTAQESYQFGGCLMDYPESKVRDVRKPLRKILFDHILGAPLAQEG